MRTNLRLAKIFKTLASLASLSFAESTAQNFGLPKSLQNLEFHNANGALSSTPHPVNIFNSDGVDPRIVIITNSSFEKLFLPIGIVETEKPVPNVSDEAGVTKVKMQKARGTGFLISPCLVLTNYHIVFGDSTSPDERFGASFYAPAGDGKNYKKIHGTPILWGPLDSYPSKENDWALLKIDVCEGKKNGWLEIDLRETAKLLEAVVASAGHPADKNINDLWLDPLCYLKNVNSSGRYTDLVQNTCALLPGASGSPVFDLKNGYPQVLAMQSSEIQPTEGIQQYYDASRANLAIDIRSIYPRVKDLILGDIAAFSARNPALPDEP